MKRIFISLVLLGLFSSMPALAAVEVLDEPVIGGEAHTLIVRNEEGVRQAGVDIEGVYYPATEIEEHAILCTTDERGECVWTPRYSGLVRLTALKQSQVIGVRYPSMPVSALLIFLFAGSLLFGGLAWSMYHLFTAPLRDEEGNAA